MAFSVGQTAADSDDGDLARLNSEAKPLPLEQIINQLKLKPTDRILEIEREYKKQTEIYKIEFVTQEGQILELIVDAQTGAIIKWESD